MTARRIRIATTGVVAYVAAAAAVVSYRHAYILVRGHGESVWSAAVTVLTVDGLLFCSGMVLLDSARRQQRPGTLPYVTLVIGIAATLAANVSYGLGHGPVGAVIAAWPAVALTLSYELLMRLIRRTASPERVGATAPTLSPDGEPDTRTRAAAIVAERPEIPVAELAAELGVSSRHARRIKTALTTERDGDHHAVSA